MSAYPVNKERINYSRLCRAIVDLCTDVFRNILYRRINANNLMTTLTKCADIRGFKRSDLIHISNAAGSGSYKDFDISLLYQILRTLFLQDLRNALETNIDPSQIYIAVQNCSTLLTCNINKLTSDELNAICHSMTTNSYDNLKDELLWKLYGQLCKSSTVTSLVHPTMSWGQNPDPGTITLGDDIERIRILRNTVYGHITTTQINDVDFRIHWTTLSDVIKRMERYLGSGYKKSLDEIEESSLDMKAEKKYLDQISKLGENISDLDTSFANLTEKQEEMTGYIIGLKTEVTKVTETQDEMAGNVSGIKTKVVMVTETQDNMTGDFTRLKTEVAKITEIQDEMAGDVTGIKSEVTKVTETQDRMAVDITGLKTGDATITEKQDKMAWDVHRLKTETTKVTKIQDGMAVDITGLKRIVATVTAKQNMMVGDVTGLKTEVATVTETNDKVVRDVAGLNTNVATVTETQDKMAGEVAGLKTEVATVTEKQDKMAGDVTGLKTKVATATEKHEKMVGAVTGLKTKITMVTENQDKMAGDVAGLKTEVASVTETQDKIAGAVTGLKTKITMVTENQDKMAGDVAGLKTEVATVTEKQDKMAGAVTGLKTEVTMVTENQNMMAGDVAGLKTEVLTITKSQKVLAKKFSKVKKAIVPDPVSEHLRKKYSKFLKVWEDDDKVFTETKACVNVRKAIKQNTFVTVSGNAGSGKSAIIHHIALEYKSNGFNVLLVKDPDDIDKYLQVDQKQLFVYDDPLGIHCINRDKFIKWLDFNIESSEMTKNMKVLCSVRRQILNDPDYKTQLYTLNKMVVDIEDDNNRLSLTEKVKMIKKHSEVRQIKLLVTDNAKKIIENQKESFPLLCRLYVSSDELKKNNDWTFHQHLFKLILEDLEKMKINDKVKYCILILCLISDNGLNPELYIPFSTDTLEKDIPFILACELTPQLLVAGFRNGYKSLLNVYLKWENAMLSFSHDLILDVVAYHFGQNYPNVILEHFPFEFISRRVIVGAFDKNDQYMIRLESKNISNLVDRMLKELEKREFKHVFMNKSWLNHSFLEAFSKKTVDKAGNFCQNVLSIFTEPQKLNIKIKSELKHMSESNALSTWTWYFRAMFLLRFTGVTALHWIAAFGYINLFKFIWNHLSYDQKCSVGKGIPLLHLACLGGDKEIFNMVLQTERKKVNTPFSHDCDLYPIHLAVYKNEDIIKDLIKLGADINVKNSSGRGRTAIFYAVACKNVKVCTILIQHGSGSGQCECSCCTSETYNDNKLTSKSISKINIYQKDDNGFTPLHISAQNNSAGVAKLLLEYKANPNLCTTDGCSPLYISAQNNSADVAKLLLENEADPNMCFKNGASPLYTSANNNSADVAKLLLEKKADPNLCKNNGCSPLYISAQKNIADVAKLLLENKADPNLCNNNGCSPLYISAQNNSADVAKLLLEYKADPNLCNNKGFSPLYISAQNNSADVTKLLLESKADPNLCKNNGCSPLHIAAQINNADAVKLLLEYNADPNLCNNNGCSPLYISARSNTPDVSKLLLEFKAEPNLCEKNGCSPLWISAHNNSADVAKLLLQCKADPYMCNNNGCSPLSISEQTNSVDVTQLLLQYRANPNVDGI